MSSHFNTRPKRAHRGRKGHDYAGTEVAHVDRVEHHLARRARVDRALARRRSAEPDLGVAPSGGTVRSGNLGARSLATSKPGPLVIEADLDLCSIPLVLDNSEPQADKEGTTRRPESGASEQPRVAPRCSGESQ